MLYELKDGRVVGCFQEPQEGRNLLPEKDPKVVAALALDAAEIAERNARAQRNALLAATDHTQLPDSPVDQAAWATYRQKLRDLPAQKGFPARISWPEKPA